MKAIWKSMWTFVAVLLLAGFVLGGCMTERSPIDKTNPLALDKKLFEGEYFFKQTIVDIPYSVDYAFIGETNDLKMIRWEITENWLYGWSLHDKIDVTDTEGNSVPARTPLITFPIRDHFDIMLGENTTTGEDLPVLVENRDKPWWQRRYFVIDPSSNVIADFDLKYMRYTIAWDNPFQVTPVAGYYGMEFHDKTGKAIDPKDYEMRHLSGKEDQLVDTFSVINEIVVNPNNYWNWSMIESWEDLIEFSNMEPARIKLRNFFWRVNRDELDNNGFTPMEFHDNLFRRFGFFVREYRGYDPQVGYRENYYHHWANYFNIEGDNQIVYYLGPDFPQRLELTACSIAADYNHAMSKAYYEGQKATQAWKDSNGESGFVSDFPEQIKMADGLFQVNLPGATAPTSLFMPDANAEWPDDYKLSPFYDASKYESAKGVDKLKWKKYYYVDYNIESLKPPAVWDESDQGKFQDRQEAMAEQLRNYCFHRDDPTDKFVLKRNEMLQYDYVRDGVNPEGLPNFISPDEIHAIYGENINDRVARPVDYPVACEQTLERRCKIDSNGNKIARWKYELGDGRYSFIYWVDTPTEYGILGVAQWSDNPETGQIFGGVGHIAGSVLQWSVNRELEQYYMMDELKEIGFDPSSDVYTDLINDIIIQAPYTKRPQSGEEDEWNYEEVTPPSAPSIKAPMAHSPKVGTPQWNLAQAAINPKTELSSSDFTNARALHGNQYEEEDYQRLERLREKKLPEMKNLYSLASLKGTPYERWMTPNGVLGFFYPGASSYDEDMLYDISPVYWGSDSAMADMLDRETEISKGCYFMGEWLSGGFLQVVKNLDDAGYTREDIRGAIERIMFKGVAEHELGHSMGLRHNFMGSADELNYVGKDAPDRDSATGYWHFKDDVQTQLDQKVADFEAENGRDITPQEKFLLEKTIATPRDWYMYSSVMDYMDDFFYHGFGLGRWDVAALLYVYGKGVEKYKMDGQNNVQYRTYIGEDSVPATSSIPQEEIQPLFEWRKCSLDETFEDDVYNSACSCSPGVPRDGEDDNDCICSADKYGSTYCVNVERSVNALRKEPQVKLVANDDGTLKAYPVAGTQVEIQLNGDNRPYLYCPDNWRMDNPMCNVWDKGYTARDIIRNMADQYKKFYYWRFFRRGNPKFKSMFWWQSFWRLFPFAHFALDFNYNQFQVAEWQDVVLDSGSDPFDPNISQARKEYILAMAGVEEWEEKDSEGNDVRKTLTPGGPGDYLIAGMEGFNFLTYDILYSPDVGRHVLYSWPDNTDVEFFRLNPYIYSDEDLESTVGGAMLDVDLRYGHYHKNYYDRQDNLAITQARLIRRGFTVEKDAASYILANSGWYVEKYRHESMANSFSYVSEGFENAIYHMMSDIMNEDHMWSFSRYCAEKVGNKYEVRVVQPRTQELFLWNFNEGWAESRYDRIVNDTTMTDEKKAEALKFVPVASDPTLTFCEKAEDPDEDLYLTDIHASWVYFDKFFQIMWTMFNQSNMTADNTPYQYYISRLIPATDRKNWAPPDEYEVETLNSKENFYIRARRFPHDSRKSPIYNLIARHRSMMMDCVRDADYVDEEQWGEVPGGLVPGNIIPAEGDPDGTRCAGPYSNQRDVYDNDWQKMEATIELMNGFALLWNNYGFLFGF